MHEVRLITSLSPVERHWRELNRSNGNFYIILKQESSPLALALKIDSTLALTRTKRQNPEIAQLENHVYSEFAPAFNV